MPSSPDFTPEFKGPIEGYVVNFMNKNYFKVARTLERSDVMQEAYVVFMRVASTYPEVEAPQHFMALFKTSWYNHFTNLANADTASRIMVQPVSYTTDEGGEIATDYAGDLDNDGYLSVMVSQAPSEVTQVLNLFLSAPQELLDLALGAWKGRDRRCRTGGSKRICQMLGITPERDVLKIIEEYFKPL